MEDFRSCTEAWPSSPVSEGVSMHALTASVIAFIAAVLIIKVQPEDFTRL